MTNEAVLKCPKCGFGSGNDWMQCRGVCPMPMSPYYRPGWSPTGVKELLAEYQVVHDALHRRWTNAVGVSGYVKADWITVCDALSSRYRDAVDVLRDTVDRFRTLSEALPVVINQDVSPDVPVVAHEPSKVEIPGHPGAVIVYRTRDIGADGSDDAVIAVEFHDDGDGWPQITVMECFLSDGSKSQFEQNCGIDLPFDVVERIASLVRNRKASEALDNLPANQEEPSLKESFLSDARLSELLDGGYETQDEVHAMAMELSMQRKRNLPGGSQ